MDERMYRRTFETHFRPKNTADDEKRSLCIK